MCGSGTEETLDNWVELGGLTQAVAHVYVSQGGKMKSQIGGKLKWKSSRDWLVHLVGWVMCPDSNFRIYSKEIIIAAQKYNSIANI